jgi:hypothetical protein
MKTPRAGYKVMLTGVVKEVYAKQKRMHVQLPGLGGLTLVSFKAVSSQSKLWR